MSGYDDLPPSFGEQRSSLTAPMGVIGYYDSRERKSRLYSLSGGEVSVDKDVVDPNRPAMLAKGLATCFAVAAIGPRATLMAHVPGYLAHSHLADEEEDVRRVMRQAFRKIWDKYRDHFRPDFYVVLVPRPYTDTTRMMDVFRDIFPKLRQRARQLRICGCERHPNPIQARHGQALVMVSLDNHRVKKVFVEDIEVLCQHF